MFFNIDKMNGYAVARYNVRANDDKHIAYIYRLKNGNWYSRPVTGDRGYWCDTKDEAILRSISENKEEFSKEALAAGVKPSVTLDKAFKVNEREVELVQNYHAT